MSNTILLVGHDPDNAAQLTSLLEPLGQTLVAASEAEALKIARACTIDLVLLGVDLSQHDAANPAEMPWQGPAHRCLSLCAAFKRDPTLARVPVVVLTNLAVPEFEVEVIENGAADVIAQPCHRPLLLARVKAQLRAKRDADVQRSALTVDKLTDVSNRRHFDDVLVREWRRVQRSGDPIALLLIDVDHFALFNATYGRNAGDACLRAVALAMRQAIRRSSDEVARVGGEAFALLLPDTPRLGAERIARHALEAVAQLAIPHERSAAARCVSVSIGVAYYDDSSVAWVPPSAMGRGGSARPAFDSNDLARCADVACTAAKQAGRAQAWRLDVGHMAHAELACLVGSPLRHLQPVRQSA